MFGVGKARRFTPDSPILPDVWLRFAGVRTDAQDDDGPIEVSRPIKLLLTPLRDTFSGNARKVLAERLEKERGTPAWRALAHEEAPSKPRIVYNQSTVAATLLFADVLRVVLPMTDWWWRTIGERVKRGNFRDKEIRAYIALAVRNPENPPPLKPKKGQKVDPRNRITPDILWLVRVIGVLAMLHRGEVKAIPEPLTRSSPDVRDLTEDDWKRITDSALDAIAGLEVSQVEATVYSVTLNRRATPTVFDSTLAIKADAGRRLFNINCSQLTWAVLDTGIEATHPAFLARKADGTAPKTYYDRREKINNTRIRRTFDFTCIDMLVDPDLDEADLPPRLRKRMKEIANLRDELRELRTSVEKGRTVDWKLLEKFLEIPIERYEPPLHEHGTHVAGILAADWRIADGNGARRDIVGVCPDINVYDFRVLDKEGAGDEFNIMCALQFIRFLNSTNDFVAVHGVNLSMSIPHDVMNYACGRTPVCEEAERVIQSGVVVVAAAGNQGYRKLSAADGTTLETYSSISVTDPGNAELVLTVGATHRSKPHTYGVSYFSSRGPTGDGRSKPDLVAPGEKITSTLLGATAGRKDGTSQAAPHVSGAAALLMARHSEFVGRPMRVKELLCETATDLGRERYFQGAGMLDILRALQSV